MSFWFDRLIYTVKSGSHGYGTSTADSDLDVRGVCIPPTEYLIGLKKWDHYESKKPDIVIYSLHKFVNLALGCNPNVIEILHVREQEVLRMTPAGEKLRQHAHIFISKAAFHTFGGYALSQLKLLQHQRTARHGTHAELVEMYGFDTKNALHLIRLLRMGIEILRTGEVHTFRPDAQELLDIRFGKWPLEKVLAEADRLNEELKLAHAESGLPTEPDFETANKLVIELTKNALEDRL